MKIFRNNCTGRGDLDRCYTCRFDDNYRAETKWNQPEQCGTSEIDGIDFAQLYQQHVVNEIRYLALARTSDDQPGTKQIDRVWPVLDVSRKRRHELTIEQAGKRSDSEEEFYLFELGRPLTLPRTVRKVPHRPVINTMKLTTLSLLEKQEIFSLLGTVYPEAMSAVSR